jgi:hypothetical protein
MTDLSSRRAPDAFLNNGASAGSTSEGLMTVMEVSMLVIATINVVMMLVIVMLLLRVKSIVNSAERLVMEQGVPLIEKLNQVASDVKNISNDARRVEQRVSGVATMVIDQVEPPVRQFAALLAGVRAGVGRIFEARQAHNGHVMVHRTMRKE